MKIGRRVMMPIYLRPEQVRALKKLSEATDAPMQVYLREGVDLVLAKHARKRKRGGR